VELNIEKLLNKPRALDHAIAREIFDIQDAHIGWTTYSNPPLLRYDSDLNFAMKIPSKLSDFLFCLEMISTGPEVWTAIFRIKIDGKFDVSFASDERPARAICIAGLKAVRKIKTPV